MVHLDVREQATQEPGDEPRATTAWARAGRAQWTEGQMRLADADPRISGQSVATGPWSQAGVGEAGGGGGRWGWVAVGRKDRSGDDVAIARDMICAPQAGPTAAIECRAECHDGEEVGHASSRVPRRSSWPPVGSQLTATMSEGEDRIEGRRSSCKRTWSSTGEASLL